MPCRHKREARAPHGPSNHPTGFPPTLARRPDSPGPLTQALVQWPCEALRQSELASGDGALEIGASIYKAAARWRFPPQADTDVSPVARLPLPVCGKAMGMTMQIPRPSRGFGWYVPVPEIMAIIVSGMGILIDASRQSDADGALFHRDLKIHGMADVPQAPSTG